MLREEEEEVVQFLENVARDGALIITELVVAMLTAIAIAVCISSPLNYPHLSLFDTKKFNDVRVRNAKRETSSIECKDEVRRNWGKMQECEIRSSECTGKFASSLQKLTNDVIRTM